MAGDAAQALPAYSTLSRMRFPPRSLSRLLTAFAVTSAGSFAALPSGQGIAAAHPSDADLHLHPAVLLHENFESGALEELSKRWSDISNKDGKVLAFSSDQPIASGGKRSLQMTLLLLLSRLASETGCKKGAHPSLQWQLFSNQVPKREAARKNSAGPTASPGQPV